MMRIHDAVTALYNRANDHMTPSELGEVGATMLDQAESAARNLSSVAEGIGCLVSNDGMQDSPFGSFQDSDSVSKLLWSISQQADMIAALVWVGSEARLTARSKEAAFSATAMTAESEGGAA